MKLDNSKVLVFSILIASIPLYFWLPAWIAVWSICFSLLQLSGYIKAAPLSVSSAFGVIGVGILLLTFGSTYSMDFCVALLTILAAIKPLEAKTHRDRAITLCMAYFVTLTGLWYSNAISVAIYSCASLLLTTSALGFVNGAFKTLKNSGRIATRILAQALPLALLLFLAFPRLEGSLWGLNVSAISETGFSDSFSLGDVSELAQDNSVAFRVQFENEIPAPQERYWRGVVFSNFNGRDWTENQLAPLRKEPLEGLDSIDYTVILEPHGRSWIFSLDFASGLPPKTLQMENGVVRSYRKITERKLFKLSSSPSRLHYIDNAMRRLSTQTFEKQNPKITELVRSWDTQNMSEHQIIDKVLDFLAGQEITYTLSPAPTRGEHLDDFIFRTKEGYCEHMASAFTYMIRLAGLPARVVGGYLGGELNPTGNYMIVRQADAHVWSEVWTKDKGWYRIDPTTVVTSTIGGREQFSQTEASYRRNQGNFLFKSLLLKLSLKLDSANFTWHKWVLSYTKDKQMELLESLGLRGKHFMTSMLVFGGIGLTFALGLITSFLFHSAGRRQLLDPIGRSYERLLSKLEKKGMKKPDAMGPEDYQKQLADQLPEVEEAINSVMELYIKLRYTKDPSPADAEAFSRQVKDLRL